MVSYFLLSIAYVVFPIALWKDCCAYHERVQIFTALGCFVGAVYWFSFPGGCEVNVCWVTDMELMSVTTGIMLGFFALRVLIGGGFRTVWKDVKPLGMLLGEALRSH